MQKLLILLILLCFTQFESQASHIRGGSITYECIGGDYVFELVVYRDCNGAELSVIAQQLKVWNHPVLNGVTCDFVSRTDISPLGTEVAGGPSCYHCGGGASTGNGLGSIEKFVYRSAPINFSGVPPVDGWILTYDNVFRSGAITNLQNADSYGMTLVAKIFNASNPINNCVDNSVKFLQEPHFVSCAGKPFTMNLNAVDPDLDSIAISFDRPLDSLGNATFNPPTTPQFVPYSSGFSVNSPTPGPAVNPGNITAQVDPTSGEITFVCFTTGSYVVKVKARSYRNGQLISEVENELQIEVTNCLGNNNPPVITPPFAGSFETTVNAGDLVNFTLTSTDVELLQDGSPQSNYINPTGLMFGTNGTATTGCIIPPCATVSSAPPITGVQGASVNFSWQTSCDHVVNADGTGLDVVPYNFVFRVQDNYCPVPEVVYATVTINVRNLDVIQAPAIDCIQGNAAGDFTLTWQPVADPNGTFTEYQIHSVQDGLIATIPAIGTNTYTHVGVTQKTDYFIAVVSGCNGNATRFGPQTSCIFLDVNDLNPGTAELTWNRPNPVQQPGMNDYYYIFREYPAGTWTMIDSVSYNSTTYSEIIDICDIYLNYQIRLTNAPCDFTSNIDGGQFDDQTPPSIPVVGQVSIDTLTGETIITWNQNDQPDTYGYLVYVVDPLTGFLVELDTVYGIANTSYTYLENYSDGPLTYTVAAFDSCPSTTGAPFNLSARDPNFHTTIFLESNLNICNSSALLSWSDYLGWSNGVSSYEIYVKPENAPWFLESTTTGNSYEFVGQAGTNYCFAVKALNSDGPFSFSNQNCQVISSAAKPAYSYIHTATVVDDSYIQINYSFGPNAYVSKIELERMKKDGSFEVIQEIESPTSTTEFIDKDVDVHASSYTYRVVYYDSCGHANPPSNIGQTILLKVQTDDVKLLNYLTWSPYDDFNGALLGYHIYRGIDGVFGSFPIATVQANNRSFTDDMNAWEFTGEVCYRVEAYEGSNLYNHTEFSWSNIECPVVEPLIYIPNAFMPTGVNHEFKPVITNFDASNYLMTIFDRWGQVVFQTNNYEIGWNGRFDNTKGEAEGGTYVYMIDIHDGGGSEIVKRGFVTLLR